MAQIQLASPAKINLFLRVIRKRPDGFHELASLFQALDLQDTIHLRLALTDQLSCSMPGIPTDRSNLVSKAAHLFRAKTGLSFGLHAHIEKRIPSEAGLGGGSSNAATTLWGLNLLCGRPATSLQLQQWAAELGSDVAFFFSQGTAYCTGRGEQLQHVPALPAQELYIVKPLWGLSTPEVYRNYKPTEVLQRNPEASLHQFLKGQTDYFNDLESSAYTIKPQLKLLREHLLQRGFSHVVLAGSGSALFCVGEGSIFTTPNLFCRHVHFLTRTADDWYSPASF